LISSSPKPEISIGDDDRGNLMSPSHAAKGGHRRRYYVSRALLRGRKQDAGSAVHQAGDHRAIGCIAADQPVCRLLRLAVNRLAEKGEWNLDSLKIEFDELILADAPYNVKISGNVTRGAHREFAMASGEMTEAQFLEFNLRWIEAASAHLCDGGVFGTFIDWRGLPTVHSAATKLGLTALNLIVWGKTNAGMGSLYRSQHELLPLYRKGDAPTVNNVALGKKGRWRSNLWTYPGASSLGSEARRGCRTILPANRPRCCRTPYSTSPTAATSSSTATGKDAVVVETS
jgi:hypothetical protein